MLGFSSRRITTMIQFLSSVCVCVRTPCYIKCVLLKPLCVLVQSHFLLNPRVCWIYKSGGFCWLNPNVCWINPGCCWLHAYCRTITQLPYQAGRPHSSAAWPMSICALLLSTCREARGAHSDLPWRYGWFTS